MINIEYLEVSGINAALRAMRNPLNSWGHSDTGYISPFEQVRFGENDLKLAQNLVKSGDDHSKFMRFIIVSCDITAPIYWWKEFDTYKIGTVRLSCSTMHKIMAKTFEINDFSHDEVSETGIMLLEKNIDRLNELRNAYLGTSNIKKSDGEYLKSLWYEVIQLLPSSYNQKATVQMSYQTLRHIYLARKNHKLKEWRSFCNWIEDCLPLSKELICLEDDKHVPLTTDHGAKYKYQCQQCKQVVIFKVDDIPPVIVNYDAKECMYTLKCPYCSDIIKCREVDLVRRKLRNG